MASRFSRIPPLRGLAWSLTLDTPVPSAPALDLPAQCDRGSDQEDDLTNIREPAIIVTAESDGQVRLFVDGLLVGQAIAAGGQAEFVVGPLGNGVRQLTAEAEDTAGNISVLGVPVRVTVDTMP